MVALLVDHYLWFKTFLRYLSAFQVLVYRYHSLVPNYHLFQVFLQTSGFLKENYYTNQFNSTGGVTCDQPDKIMNSTGLVVTCDMQKNSTGYLYLKIQKICIICTES